MSRWVPERAQQLCKAEGRTTEWLADFVGIPVQSLNHYLSGRRNPKRPVIKLIAAALRSHEAYLTGESPDARAPAPQGALAG
jgi:transcriptional regulator with XRE-family HTH domain